MMNINEIIKIVPSLSYKELQEVSKHIKVYLSLKAPKHPTNNCELLYSAITSQLEKFIEPQMCFNALIKTSHFSTLKKVEKYLNSFISKFLENNMDVTRYIRQRVYTIYAKTIIDYLNGTYRSTSLIEVLLGYTHFLSELHKKYPGYIESGLGYYIFCTPDEIQKYIKVR